MATNGEITSDASAAQARKNAAYFKKLLQRSHRHEGGHAADSIREVDYKGHHITIETTYRITIDGKVFKGELAVTNDGMVHYHGMPAAGFDSAVDLIKSVIDNFPAEFSGGTGHEGGGHEGHDGHEGQAGHAHDSHSAHGGRRRRMPRRAKKPRTRRSR